METAKKYSFYRFLIGVACLAIPLQRLFGIFPNQGIFQSDIAFLPAFFEDIKSGGSITDWNLPEAAYFIPDWPLYFVAWIVTPDYQSGLAVFIFLQLLLFSFAVFQFTKQLTDRPYIATLLCLLVIVTMGLVGYTPAFFIGVSFFRFSSVILLLASLTLYIQLRKSSNDTTDKRKLFSPSGLLFFNIVCAATASDLVFIFWFTIPIVVIETLYLLPRNTRRWASLKISPTIPIALLAVAASGVGLGLGKVLTNPSGNYAKKPSYATVEDHLHILKNSWDELIRIDHNAVWFFIVFLSCLLLLCIGLSDKISTERTKHLTFLSLWYVFATLITLATESAILASSWRYHQFIFFLPVALASSVIANKVETLPFSQSRYRYVALASSPLFLLTASHPVASETPSYSSAQIRCIDRQLEKSGSREGIANYGIARLIAVESELTLDIGSRNTWLLQEQDVHSTDWAEKKADFAILTNTDFSTVHPLFGNPSSSTLRTMATVEPVEVQCGDWQLLDYGPDGLDLDPLDTPGTKITISGCWLDSENAANPECTLDREFLQSEFFGFGIYLPVDPGRYRVEANFEGQSIEGDLEVLLWNASNGEEYKKILSPVHSPSITIEVEDYWDNPSLEPRFFLGSGESISLKSYTIERL